MIAHALKDAGFEVIYTGLRQTPEQIVQTALQEDVDVIGLSILSGAHMAHLPSVLELVRREGLKRVAVFAGGIIPEQDVAELRRLGLQGVFPPGSATGEIVAATHGHEAVVVIEKPGDHVRLELSAVPGSVLCLEVVDAQGNGLPIAALDVQHDDGFPVA